MRIFKQGQVSLEIAVVFVVTLLFLLGMLRILFWGNNELFLRQRDYDQSRNITLHGTARWPIHNSTDLNDTIIFNGTF